VRGFRMPVVAVTLTNHASAASRRNRPNSSEWTASGSPQTLIDQFELQLEDLESAAAEDEAAAENAAGQDDTVARSLVRRKLVRGPLPAHLPRWSDAAAMLASRDVLVIRMGRPAMNRREILKAGAGSIAAAAVGLPAVHPARAAEWPTKSVRVVVPYAPGSATDLVPRTVLEQVGHQVGQSFVVENRPGGGTTVGSAQVKQSEPDGYTMLIHSNAIVTVPAIQANVPYDRWPISPPSRRSATCRWCWWWRRAKASRRSMS
jgi:Tripartite tricarboxylate transporter family receptor/Transposase C of IS166 homeodomain